MSSESKKEEKVSQNTASNKSLNINNVVLQDFWEKLCLTWEGLMVLY